MPPSRTPGRAPAPVVLYVEDNFLLAHAVRDALELAGCKVYHFSEAFGARTAVESETRFDLLLLDEELPRESGLELTRRARRLPHRQDTPIILCSVEDRADAARRAGSNEFLRKPADLCRLIEIVRRLLGRKEG